MKEILLNRFDPDQKPKRILSLDGGGIRGALTLGYLLRIQSIIRDKHNRPDMRLCDYFDLIGGTSTGSIIAACLAKGMTVEEVRDKYLDLGGKIFQGKYWCLHPKRLYADYSNKYLIEELKGVFGDMTLGSSDFKTGLCIVVKRADTNSTWFLINHPNGTFYELNKDILVWSALAASAAAPSYFPPQSICVGNKEVGAFVDGGVSLSNNPSLGLLQVATLNGFPFKWSVGERELLLVSVGTGYGSLGIVPSQLMGKGKLFWAKNVADYLMQDANWENQVMLQWLSNSPTSKYIDSMRCKLNSDLLAGRPLLQYLRYNFEISQNNLNNLDFNPQMSFTSKQANDLLDMSKAENRETLYQIGILASQEIVAEHFDDAFNI